MMIDSVVWAQYINVTDRHADSHVTVANAAPMHCRAATKRHVSRKITPYQSATTPDAIIPATYLKTTTAHVSAGPRLWNDLCWSPTME